MRVATLSAAMLLAVACAQNSDPQPCPACLDPENAGLCHLERCQRQVLPVMKQSSLAKDTHSGKFYEPVVAVAEPKTEHATRMAAQSAKSLTRLGRALDGHRTLVRHARRRG